ncbi:GNAT family N-acetyltransferase [Clostridium sp. HCS.1]|uniref:GNAT family N-acetyltransferase n=1 Tax=Clostridium sp. HCS.1 TaxID=3238594 RepID=UPI003A101EB1
MVIEFLKGMKEDFDDLVEFINYVFSYDGEETDFKSLLPKLYKKEYKTIENHYIVKEDTKIKAVVGTFPMDLKVLDNLSLKVSGIGSVSVHPDSRGYGYMKNLMNMALEDMKKEGIHISCLGGNRQRYEYFGYTPCGQNISYEINSDNVKHSLKKCINKNMLFKDVKDNNLDFVDKIYETYSKDKFRFNRNKSGFLDILKSWNFDVYSVYDDEIFIGYIVSNKDKSYISELKVNNDEDFISVLANFIEANNLNETNLELPVWEKKKIKELNAVAEKITINNCYQFNVLNYEEVIKQLLSFKATYSNLVNGNISFDIMEYGKFKITVENNKVIIDSFNGNCDIQLSHLKAMQLLFSPFGSYLIENEKLCGIINSWFPMPLFIGTQDKV